MSGGGIERLDHWDEESLIRYAYADSLSASGDMTNLEALEAIEAITHVEEAVRERMKAVKSEAEKKELDSLIARSFPPKCAFDRRYSTKLLTLAIKPDEVSWFWKLRERLHRVRCGQTPPKE